MVIISLHTAKLEHELETNWNGGVLSCPTRGPARHVRAIMGIFSKSASPPSGGMPSSPSNAKSGLRFDEPEGKPVPKESSTESSPVERQQSKIRFRDSVKGGTAGPVREGSRRSEEDEKNPEAALFRLEAAFSENRLNAIQSLTLVQESAPTRCPPCT